MAGLKSSNINFFLRTYYREYRGFYSTLPRDRSPGLFIPEWALNKGLIGDLSFFDLPSREFLIKSAGSNSIRNFRFFNIIRCIVFFNFLDLTGHFFGYFNDFYLNGGFMVTAKTNFSSILKNTGFRLNFFFLRASSFYTRVFGLLERKLFKNEKTALKKLIFLEGNLYRRRGRLNKTFFKKLKFTTLTKKNLDYSKLNTRNGFLNKDKLPESKLALFHKGRRRLKKFYLSGGSSYTGNSFGSFKKLPIAPSLSINNSRLDPRSKLTQDSPIFYSKISSRRRPFKFLSKKSSSQSRKSRRFYNGASSIRKNYVKFKKGSSRGN